MTQRKIVIASLLSIIAFALIMNLIIVWQVHNQVLLELRIQLETSIRLRTQGLSGQIEQLRKNTVFLAHTPPILGISRASSHQGIDPLGKNTTAEWKDRLAMIFAAFVKANAGVQQIQFIGIENHGQELVSVKKQGKAILVVPIIGLEQKMNAPYFKKALQLSDNETYVLPIKISREYGSKGTPVRPTLSVATPTFSPDGKPFGVLLIYTDAQPLLHTLRSLSGEISNTYLLNQQGDFLLHPKKAQLFGLDPEQQLRWQDEFKELPSDKSKGDFKRYTSPNGIVYVLKQQLNFNNVGLNEPLTLILTAPESLMIESVKHAILTTTLLIFVASLLSAGLFSLFFYQRRRMYTQEARTTAIINSAQDCIISRRMDGTIETWNKTAEHLFEYPAYEVMGKELKQLIFTPEAAEKDATAISCIILGEKAPNFDITLHGPNNQPLMFSVSSTPIKDKKDIIIGIVNILRDIRAEREAEKKILQLNLSLEQQVKERTKKLQELTALQQAILNHAEYAIIATELDGTITLFNPAAERMLGYCAKELIGKKTPKIWHSPNEVIERATRLSQELNETIEP